eukprot:TRINITY_DN2746_c0_g1_i2.p1 TRINITY_DN2746_c0_g1~~TRINITY_DN2746_c0_g1_i2.p1  ORF type:complete len:599 (+),score=74.30 TRINITY_DN2746_c0_g1_i2:208-2004(+)
MFSNRSSRNAPQSSYLHQPDVRRGSVEATWHIHKPGKRGRLYDDLVAFWQGDLTGKVELEQSQQVRYDPTVQRLYTKFPDLGHERIKQAMGMFHEFDKNKNGRLDKHEFTRLIRATLPGGNNRTIADKSVQLAFDLVDKDKSGEITMDEFLLCYKDIFCDERKQMAILLSPDFPSLTIDQLETILIKLEELDENDTSTVGLEEMYQLKNEFASTLSHALVSTRIDQVFKRADKDKNGELDAAEFVEAYHTLIKTMEGEDSPDPEPDEDEYIPGLAPDPHQFITPSGHLAAPSHSVQVRPASPQPGPRPTPSTQQLEPKVSTSPAPAPGPRPTPPSSHPEPKLAPRPAPGPTASPPADLHSPASHSVSPRPLPPSPVVPKPAEQVSPRPLPPSPVVSAPTNNPTTEPPKPTASPSITTSPAASTGSEAASTTSDPKPSARLLRSTSGSLSGGRSPNTIFAEYMVADSVATTMNLFQEMRDRCRLAPDAWGVKGVYEPMKNRLTNRHAKLLYSLLDHRRQEGLYNSPAVAKNRVIVVGAGPAGLRFAMEALMLGARVTIIDKRYDFSRNNLLHVWDVSIRELRNIGAKTFYPQFCIGGIK